MTLSDVQIIGFDFPPETVLDWVRVLSALMGAYFVGMAFLVMGLYRSKKPVYHVRWIAAGTALYVTAIVYAQLGLVGQQPTRISWVVAVVTCIALFPMTISLHQLLHGKQDEKDDEKGS